MTEDDSGVRAAELVGLEGSLWRADTRFDRAWMERVLHPGFHEFGRSGRRWSREEILGAAAVEIGVAWPPGQLVVAPVVPSAALLTYVLVHDDGTASNRSSLWLHDPTAEVADPASGWRLRFHQGSPTTP